jgi:hypothetical protein
MNNEIINEEVYEENISCFTYADLEKLNYYSFSIVEVNDIKYSDETKFDEKTIYEKTRELFAFKIPNIPTFTEIEDVKEILKDTEYKLVYQEQVIEILNKICGFDMIKADFTRRQIARAKRNCVVEVEKTLKDKYGESGSNFFEYFMKNSRYTIAKGYVLGTLHNLFECDDYN